MHIVAGTRYRGDLRAGADQALHETVADAWLPAGAYGGEHHCGRGRENGPDIPAEIVSD